MSLTEWFNKKKEKNYRDYATKRLDIPGNLWVKCYRCGETLYSQDLGGSLKVCDKCGYHFKLSAFERIEQIIDDGTFIEYDKDITSKDFLDFVDSKTYAKRLEIAKKKSALNEAIVTGEGEINAHRVIIGVMDFSFMGGSMASAVGEKVARAVEKAVANGFPLILFTSSGGARMHEGIMSLMQMAKTSAALAKLELAALPYICVLTDPTTGGTTASYAMLGDIQIAEPGALIGFAGPRVIEQTIRQKLPKGFQRAEYLKEHGMVDMVVERKDLKDTLTKVLEFFNHE